MEVAPRGRRVAVVPALLILAAAGVTLTTRLVAAADANLANAAAARALLGGWAGVAPAAASARAWAAASLRWHENRPAWLAIARAFEAEGRHDEALEAWGRALADAPADPYWFVLAWIEESSGNHARAIAAWRHARAERFFTTFGDELSSHDRLAEAAALLKDGRDAFPESGPIALALADVLRRQGQDLEAIQLYRATASLPGAHAPIALLHLAQLYFARREWVASVEAYEACRDHPTSLPRDRAECLVGLAEIDLWILRDRDRAWARLASALAADPRHTRALTRRGEMNLSSSRLDDALSDFERALDANRRDPYLLAMAGVALARRHGQCPSLLPSVESAARELLAGTMRPAAAGEVFSAARDACGGNPYFVQAWVFTFVWSGDDAGYRRAVEWSRAADSRARWLPF